MNYRLTFLFVIFFSVIVKAQIKAVTEEGNEVILFDDGTWEYADDSFLENEIKLNPETFTKDNSSSFLLKSSVTNFGFYLNPKEWSFTKNTENTDAEYELNWKNGDIYGMIISEEIKIPITTLREIAVSNGKTVSPDIKIIEEEYRNVNGLEVLMMKMKGTMYGIKFEYFGYYYSNDSGTVQFITYSSDTVLEKNQKLCEKLLNGITTLEK